MGQMSISQNMKIFDNSGNSGKSLAIPVLRSAVGIESAGIAEALPKMPALSKIFIFWICMGQMGQELKVFMFLKRVQYCSSDPQWSP